MRAALDLATNSAEGTRAVAEAIGTLLEPGDVVSLTGDLGAGKTAFVQGAARALGVAEPVLSPTFTLVREYEGTTRVYHLDVYRLDRLQDVLDLGFDEMLDLGGIVLIEWGDAIQALLPESYLQVELTMPHDEPETVRRLVADAQGPGWALRWERLEQLVGPWRVA